MAVELTVIVKGADGKTVQGATVTVVPGDVSGKTDSNGEVTLKIDGADKYDVTVSDKDATQTVPYYSLQGRDTARLEVNLAYLAQRENQQQTVAPSPAVRDDMPEYVLPLACALGAAILVLLLGLLFKRKFGKGKKKSKKSTKKK